MSRDPRYRGLKPHPEKLGVTPLSEGEASRPVRVRAAAKVLDWLGTLGAAEVGRLMTEAYQAAHPSSAQVIAPRPISPKPARPQESQEHHGRLVPGLYPPTKPHHAALIDALNNGAELTQSGTTFKLVYPDGSSRIIQPKTGQYLLSQGILVAAEGQDKAMASQSPQARRRDTNRAPGRRKP